MVDYAKYKVLTVDKKDKIATVTMNKPETLNAITMDLHHELEDVFAEISTDEEVNVVILTGAGRVFSAGGDLRMLRSQLGQPAYLFPYRAARRMVNNLLEVEQPVIAAVNGDAIGLAANIALLSDIIIAVDSARFSDPHVSVGLVAGDGGCVIWPLVMGMAKAKEFLMTGDFIGAVEAERMGMINKAVPKDEFWPTVERMAQRLANGPTWAIRWTKFSLNKLIRQRANLLLDTSAALEAVTTSTQDHAEAINAFLEKRAPQFKGQ